MASAATKFPGVNGLLESDFLKTFPHRFPFFRSCRLADSDFPFVAVVVLELRGVSMYSSGNRDGVDDDSLLLLWLVRRPNSFFNPFCFGVLIVPGAPMEEFVRKMDDSNELVVSSLRFTRSDRNKFLECWSRERV